MRKKEELKAHKKKIKKHAEHAIKKYNKKKGGPGDPDVDPGGAGGPDSSGTKIAPGGSDPPQMMAGPALTTDDDDTDRSDREDKRPSPITMGKVQGDVLSRPAPVQLDDSEEGEVSDAKTRTQTSRDPLARTLGMEKKKTHSKKPVRIESTASQWNEAQMQSFEEQEERDREVAAGLEITGEKTLSKRVRRRSATPQLAVSPFAYFDSFGDLRKEAYNGGGGCNYRCFSCANRLPLCCCVKCCCPRGMGQDLRLGRRTRVGV